MKILTLKVNGKTHTTGKITAFLAKQAININKEALKLAKTGQAMADNAEDIDLAERLFEEMDELNNRKAWLVCELYANKFTQDELEKELTLTELDAEIAKIIRGISGITEKN